MPRLIIIGVLLGVAFTLYSVVDAAMTDTNRARGVPKPMWIILTIILPVIGGILWFTIGKGSGGAATSKRRAPDDDPRFDDMSPDAVDLRIADLEEQLKALDEEIFPGESAESSGPIEPDEPTEPTEPTDWDEQEEQPEQVEGPTGPDAEQNET